MNYNLTLCWQAFEVEYEVTFRTSCRNYNNTDECNSYLSDDNNNLIDDNKTVPLKLVDLIISKIGTAVNQSLLKIVLFDSKSSDLLYLKLNFIGDKCDKNKTNDYDSCIEKEVDALKKETEKDFKRFPPLYKGNVLIKRKTSGL